MAVHVLKQGLTVSLTGEPEQRIVDVSTPARVAILRDDYIGLKPTVLVMIGENVKRGQTLMTDDNNPGVRYTAPAEGKIDAVNYSETGDLESIVIALSDAARINQDPNDVFAHFSGNEPPGLSRDQIKALLTESGAWTALRTRPYGRVPAVDTTPHAIFVTAMDTNPHAPDPAVVLKGHERDFERGLICIAKLTEGRTYLCKKRGAAIPANPNTGIQIEEFEGNHPAGNVGVHIQVLSPVSANKTVWHIGYQDVLAIGKLFGNGRLDVERVVALAGPAVRKPRLVRTRLGASIDELIENELCGTAPRVRSGSCLAGRVATGAVHGYLGRYHLQVLATDIASENELSGLLSAAVHPSLSSISVLGWAPYDGYKRILPMISQPSQLLRALRREAWRDAELLGTLALDEDDLAICNAVSQAKYDYVKYLRSTLESVRRFHATPGCIADA